ncbi:MAG: pyruvate formate-lyase-activating protein [Lachnospiraceae bacterium]
MVGHVHSIESFGTVDGPGVRLVVFLQGCPMRCLYCHNPDTWKTSGGTTTTVKQIMAQFEKNRSFYVKGGITVTGGEPLMQIDWVTELFSMASHRGIHTCLDTSGITFNKNKPEIVDKFDQLMSVTDLVMLDIKHIHPAEHEKLCSQPLEPILDFTRYLDDKAIPVWLRHVVVPGITYDQTALYDLGCFIGTLHNIKALDVLPYHDMGKVKYESLGMDYPLKDTRPLDKDEAIAARQVIMQGIKDTRLAKGN